MSRRMTMTGLAVLASLALPCDAASQDSPVYPGGVIDFMQGATDSVVADLDHDGLTDVVAIIQDSSDVLWTQVAFGLGDGTFNLRNPKVLASGKLGEYTHADLNGDGLIDLVGIDRDNFPINMNRLVVSLGGGNDEFDLLLKLPLSTPAASDVEIADVNADGIPDVLYVGRAEMYVLLGRGDGLFELEQLVYAAPATPATSLEKVVSGHFDGDGFPDLVVSQRSPDNVVLLRGRGDGAFDLAVEIPFPEPAGFAVADLDDDGDLDFAAATRVPAETAVFLGNGDLTFNAPLAVNTAQGAGVIAAGDYDNDGVIDLVASNPSFPLVNIMRGVGSGNFTTFKNDFVSVRAGEIVPVKLNGDLATDWVITGTSLSTGTYSVALTLGRPNQVSLFAAHDMQGNENPLDMVVADMNNDGADDHVYLRANDRAVVRLWEGDGFSDKVNLGPVQGEVQSLAVGDVDGDGARDVVVASRLSSTVSMYRGDGLGGFFLPVVLEVLHPGTSRRLAAGDLDLDGDDEIIYAVDDGDSNDAIFILDSFPAGLLSVVDVVSPVDSEGEVIDLELHDVDQDGVLDLFTLSSTSRIDVRTGVLGTTQFAPAVVVQPSPNPSAPIGLIVGRFTTGIDIVDDVILFRDDGFTWFDGRNFSGPLEFPEFHTSSDPDNVFGVGAILDRDGDELDEFVMPNLTEARVEVVQRTFFAPTFEVVERLPIDARLVGVGRVNGDEFDDIVALAETTSVAGRQPKLPWDALGGGTAPFGDALPTLLASGDPSPGEQVRLEYTGGLPGVPPILVVGGFMGAIPLQGGVVVPSLDILIPLPLTDGFGDLTLDVTWTDFPPGIRIWTQVWQVAGPDTHASNTLTVESR